MAGPPPPPFSATWRIQGLVNDQQRWQTGWHLSLPGQPSPDFAGVRELHQDLVTWTETELPALLASTVVCTLSRLVVNGVTSSIGDELYLFAIGERGAPVPSAIAVPVVQQVQAVGRGRNGRFWLPPPAYSDVDFGFQLTPSAHSVYSTGLTNIFNGVNAIVTSRFPSVRFAVLHRREHGAYLGAAIIQPVDTWRLSRKLGTQDLRMSSSRAA